MNRRRELPDTLTAPFSVAQALAAGVSDRRLDAADLVSDFRGARRLVTPTPQLRHYERLDYELRVRCGAYLPVGPADALFSHETAARLYGMPLPDRLLGNQLHVLTALNPPRRVGVVGHRGDTASPQRAHGLPVVSAEIVWLQLAAVLGLDELVVAGDYLVRRKRPLSSLPRLEHAVRSAARYRGVRHASTALRDIRPLTDSPPESILRLILVRAGLPEPLVHYTVFDNGYWVGTPDLAYPVERVAIEYQGEGHRDARIFEEDIVRLDLFHDAGWKVLQVTKTQLRDPAHLAARVRRALASHS